MPSLAAEQRIIASQSKELVPDVGMRMRWLSEDLGRISLLNMDVVSALSVPHFELCWIGRQNLELQVYPSKKFVYLGTGAIMGVLKTNYEHIPPDDEEKARIEQAMKFQLDNKLYAPDVSDYQHLAELLQSEKEEMEIIND